MNSFWCKTNNLKNSIFTKYFSYPSKEHWNIIKTHFNEIKYDEELNYEENKEWK